MSIRLLKKIVFNKLYNILKGLSASLTVYQDTDYCGSEQCNDRVVLAKKELVKHAVKVRLSFSRGAFDIERMIEEKIVSSDFAEAW